MMRNTVCLILLATLGSIDTTSQSLADAQIAGRITDRQFADKPGSVLPGARITLTSGDERREAITDAEGRFEIKSLKVGTYRVAVELAGFVPVSGSVTLSPEGRRAHLEWSLEVSCLEEVVRINFGVRDAANVADAIVHLRVDTESEPVQWSVNPSCAGGLNREYLARAMETVVLRENLAGESDLLQILKSGDKARLRPGEEYFAYLSWQPRLNRYLPLGDNLIFPVREGRVVSPRASELNGMRVAEALEVVRRWAEQRRPHR